jgi:hypothetical protein
MGAALVRAGLLLQETYRPQSGRDDPAGIKWVPISGMPRGFAQQPRGFQGCHNDRPWIMDPHTRLAFLILPGLTTTRVE